MRHLRPSVAALAVALVVAIGAGLPVAPGHATLAGLAGTARAADPAPTPTSGPKVVIIVGATHGATATYRSYADAAYAEAIKYTPNVVKVYSPNATWSAVQAAAKGANILIYFGHGNGWPSPYTYDAKYTTKDGFGLNATAGNGDYNNKYYGEPYVSTLQLADHALVMLHHLCYASGNSEPGGAAPSLSTAKQRVDNYGAGFLKTNAAAVLADGHRGPVDYLRAIFTTNQTIAQLWRNAPNANDHVITFAGTRSAGATAFMDPDNPTSGYYRSLIGDPDVTTRQITGGFSVPGGATPKADAPLYDEVPPIDPPAADTTAIEPAATVPAGTRLRLLERAAGSGDTAIFRVRGIDDDTITGFMRATDLLPGDSMAPWVKAVTGGAGKAFAIPKGEMHTLNATLSEAATWTATITRSGTTYATAEGTGSAASVGFVPSDAAGDGTYTYTVTASDDWGNGPSTTTGTFVIDNVAPKLLDVTPNADTIKWVSPNGDRAKESVTWVATQSEAGSVGLTIVDGDGATVRSLRVNTTQHVSELVWDGRTSAGKPVPDGTYTARITPRDRAGTDGKTVTRPVLVDTSLGDVDVSKTLFYPQDGDSLAKSITLRFALTREAKVTWTLVDSTGAVALTLLDGVTLPAGPVTKVFDGKRADGTYLPRGSYRSVVTLAGDGPVEISQYRTFSMRAFLPTASDTTPGRGQKITVTATSAEGLSTTPKVYVYQPGKTTWSVTMTKVSTGKYQATLTVKTGGGKGEIRFQVKAKDTGGRSQSSNLYLPLH